MSPQRMALQPPREQTVNETQPQGQDPRNARTGFGRRRHAQWSDRRRRRRVPHQPLPRADRRTAGSAFAPRSSPSIPSSRLRPKLRVGKFANGGGADRGQTFTLDNNPEPGNSKGLSAASRNPELGRGRPPSVDRRRQLDPKALKSDGSRSPARSSPASFPTEGRQPARHRPAGRCADRKDRKDLDRCSHRRRLGGAVVVQRPEDLAKPQDRARRALIMAKIESRRPSPGWPKSSNSPMPDGRARRSRCRNAMEVCPVSEADTRARAPASRWSSPRRCWNR